MKSTYWFRAQGSGLWQERFRVPGSECRGTAEPSAPNPEPFFLRALSPQPRAFSLIEIVIAMAILSVGVVGAMRVFPVGLRASQRAELSSRAAMVAGRTLEALKLKPWSELTEGEEIEQVDELTVTTRIAHPFLTQLSDPTRLHTIDVQVEWIQEGRPRTMNFVTYVRRE